MVIAQAMTPKFLENGSLLYGALPTGCYSCGPGQKLVLFVTGLCSQGCYYCPVSQKKMGVDVVYANELQVSSDQDVINEARLIDALGTGITGGNPSCVEDRVLHYIELLKTEFGPEHHIHLYTSDFENERFITDLARFGLDEIRFHLPPEEWKSISEHHILELARSAKKQGLATGFELPVPPGLESELHELAKILDANGVEFLNLNEFEISDTNWEALRTRGYEPGGDHTNAVKGSLETARAVLEGVQLKMSIHFCSSSFKDGVQLRNRICRRAENTKKPHELITKDGTFVKGVVECQNPEELRTFIIKEYDVPEELAIVDDQKERLEVAAWVLEELAPLLDFDCFITEEYPTADRLEVERLPL